MFQALDVSRWAGTSPSARHNPSGRGRQSETTVVADETVARNLQRMDELDFAGGNQADWEGVFTRYHADDVLVDVHGQDRRMAFVST